MPPQRKRHLPVPRYLIELAGLASATVWEVTIDDRFWLTPLSPSTAFAVVPVKGRKQPSLAEAVFYADALAYDHDSPTLVRPRQETALLRPIVVQEPFSARWYYDSQAEVLYALASIRFGGDAVLVFRWEEGANELLLTARLESVKKEVSLYASATRQVDPMSEFLCLYRVLESVSTRNGVDWIADHLSDVGSFDFGRLELADFRARPDEVVYTNVFAVLKRRAKGRLRTLTRSVGSPKDIARYLYSIRNDIAHGKTSIRVYDHGATVATVGRELPLMRLLARMAIELKRINRHR